MLSVPRVIGRLTLCDENSLLLSVGSTQEEGSKHTTTQQHNNTHTRAGHPFRRSLLQLMPMLLLPLPPKALFFRPQIWEPACNMIRRWTLVAAVAFPQIVQKVVQGNVDLHRLEQALGGDCDRAVRLRRQVLERLR